ncbi:MAG: hypothetical protein IPP71_16455 [Bacteroidetes bacterium]|nr:hypothetical protein [Bacteroidota bacterium]
MIFRSVLYYIALISCQFFSTSINAQEKNAQEILGRVSKKFQIINEYEANVTIKVDVDFIKIPIKKGTIWFMQPDKIKVKTPGFSLLPKRGMNFTPNQVFKGNYTAIYIREEKIETIATHVIKIIPDNEQDEVILSTVWVDVERNVIRKLESTTKNEGTISMVFKFGTPIKKFDLPDQILFTFDLRKNELPLGLTGDFESTPNKDKKLKNSKGTVTISYLEYFVNQGRAKSIFDDVKAKKSP